MHYIRHMWNATSELNIKPELNRQMFQSQSQETLPGMYNKNNCPGEELLLKKKLHNYYLHFIFNNSIETNNCMLLLTCHLQVPDSCPLSTYLEMKAECIPLCSSHVKGFLVSVIILDTWSLERLFLNYKRACWLV